MNTRIKFKNTWLIMLPSGDYTVITLINASPFFFWFVFGGQDLLSNPGNPGTHWVDHAGLQCEMHFLPLPLKHWDYRCAIVHPDAKPLFP